MKLQILSAALCVALLPSCTTARGTANGDWSFASVGTDSSNLSVAAQGLNVEAMNQSAGLTATLTAVKQIWQTYLVAEGLKFIGQQYYNAKNVAVSARKAADLEKLRNARSASQSAAALERLKFTTAAEQGVLLIP